MSLSCGFLKKRVFQYSSHNTQNNLSFQSFQVIVIFLARLFSVLTDADCESLISAANPQRQSGWEKPLMTPQLYDNQHLVCGVTGFWNLITTLVFQLRVFFLKINLILTATYTSWKQQQVWVLRKKLRQGRIKGLWNYPYFYVIPQRSQPLS